MSMRGGRAAAWCVFGGLMLLGWNCAAQEELKGRILGKWQVNRDKSVEYLRQNTPSDQETTDPELTDVAGLQVHFLEDGVVQVVKQGTTMEGRWKFVKQTSPSQADVELIRDDEATPAKIEFTAAGSMLIQPERERALVFDRVEESAPETTPAMPVELGALAKQYVGDWKGDTEETKKLEFNAQFDADEVAAMLEQMKELDLHVGADGGFLAKFGLADQSMEMVGQWRPLEENAETKTLVVDVKLENGPQTKFNVLFIDDKTIRMAPDDQPAIILRRKPAVTEKQ